MPEVESVLAEMLAELKLIRKLLSPPRYPKVVLRRLKTIDRWELVTDFPADVLTWSIVNLSTEVDVMLSFKDNPTVGEYHHLDRGGGNMTQDTSPPKIYAAYLTTEGVALPSSEVLVSVLMWKYSETEPLGLPGTAGLIQAEADRQTFITEQQAQQRAGMAERWVRPPPEETMVAETAREQRAAPERKVQLPPLGEGEGEQEDDC